MIGNALQLNLHTPKLVCLVNCASCTQCLVEANGKRDRCCVMYVMVHSNHVSDVSSDCLSLRFRIAGVQQNTLHVIRKALKQGRKRFGLNRMGSSKLILEAQLMVESTVTREMDDSWLNVQQRLTYVCRTSRQLWQFQPEMVAQSGDFEFLLDFPEFFSKSQS